MRNSGIEATSKLAPGLVEGLDDGRVGVGLDGVVGLHAGQVLLELGVVAAQFVVVHHEQRRAVFLRPVS